MGWVKEDKESDKKNRKIKNEEEQVVVKKEPTLAELQVDFLSRISTRLGWILFFIVAAVIVSIISTLFRF